MSNRSATAAAIRVQALFFAAYRDLIGAAELEFELPRGSTLANLIEAVRARVGAALPEAPVAAVNQEYATPDTVLQHGDEVAFIPPVAGG